MQQLWAPWRLQYIVSKKARSCIFCHHPSRGQNKNALLLYAGVSSLVLLNRFPYTNCHLLVAPRRHTNNLSTLQESELADLFSVVSRSIELLKHAVKPDGFNVGMNLGKVAGAGITRHLHLHIVPRWLGDTNYMPIVAEAVVLPQHLEHTYAMLAPLFATHFKS